MRAMQRTPTLLGCILALSGCASSSAVRSSISLPVKQVVLYRSGVGYFERAGSFDGQALAFSVRKEDVGDFLASLTAVDKQGAAVSSIAFESKAPEKQKCETESCPMDKDEGRVDVQVMLASGGEHALDVSYVVGSPIWRPSYRVVLDKGEKALLQAWAVVQNLSGEDWKDVRLALTTGAPISFRSDLGTPITPERPLVSDEGEVIASVPMGEVAVAQEPAMPPAPMAAVAEMAADSDMAKEESLSMAAAKPMYRARSKAAASMAPQMTAGVLEQAVKPQASAQSIGASVTRYDLNTPVTVPDGGSTMVAIVSTRVAGEKAHLFAPEPGVGLSEQHPFSVVRLTNESGAVLEKGPVAVMSNGAFLGQGLLDTLPKAAQAFVPFALDKSVVVEPSAEYGEEQGALVRIQRGQVTVQRFSQRKSHYHVRNGGEEDAKVYVRHARWGEAELVSPPPGTELTPGKALVPVSVKAHGDATLQVVERTPVQLVLSFWDQPAADAVALWLSGAAADLPQTEPLKRALAIRSELFSVQNVLNTAEQEQGILMQNAEETRGNLKAIEKVKSADDLRSRLVGRLKQLDTRIAELTKQIVDARTKQSELSVRLNDALDSVSLETSK
ncbi:MAG: hypothetical protein RL385_3123 [Pseudomonadota bacterium]|jgi:hypothetical protein